MSKHARTQQEKEVAAKYHRAVVAVLTRHECPFANHAHLKPWTPQDLEEVTQWGLTTCRRYLDEPPANYVGMWSPKSVEELVTQVEVRRKEATRADQPDADKELLTWRAAQLKSLIDALLELRDPIAVARVLNRQTNQGSTPTVSKAAAEVRPAKTEAFECDWPLARPDCNALLAVFYARHGRRGLERMLNLVTASDPSTHMNDLLRRVNDQVETLNAALAAICEPLSESIGAQEGIIEPLDEFVLRASVFVTVPNRTQSTARLLCRVARSQQLEEAATETLAGGTTPSAAHITTDSTKFVVARAAMQEGVCYAGPEAAMAPGLRDHTYAPVAVSALRFNIDGSYTPAVRGVVSLDAMTFATSSVKAKRAVFKALSWRADGALWIEKALRGIARTARKSVFGPVPAEGIEAFVEEFNLDVDHG